jgi:hypothetical protein
MTTSIGTTPLLVLLDGILSQEDDRVDQAMADIRRMLPFPMRLPHPKVSPIQSTPNLIATVEQLLSVQPQIASIVSEHDGSLPLHFAASLGIVPVASLIMQAVSVID